MWAATERCVASSRACSRRTYFRRLPAQTTRHSPQVSAAKPDLVNIGCVPVGRAIFNARPDVNSIIHAHPHAVMAVATTERGLLPVSQAAFFLHGQIGRYKCRLTSPHLISLGRYNCHAPTHDSSQEPSITPTPAHCAMNGTDYP